MMLRIVICLIIFWVMQVIAQVFFKWGSMSEARWLWGFLVGNLFGFSSIWLLMILYRGMNVNITLGIATGGAFLMSQITLALMFKSRVTPLQWLGIVAIVAGMLALCMARQEEKTGGVPDTLQNAPVKSDGENLVS